MVKRELREIRKGLKNRTFKTKRERDLLKQISRYGKISFKKEYYQYKNQHTIYTWRDTCQLKKSTDQSRNEIITQFAAKVQRQQWDKSSYPQTVKKAGKD